MTKNYYLVISFIVFKKRIESFKEDSILFLKLNYEEEYRFALKV